MGKCATNVYMITRRIDEDSLVFVFNSKSVSHTALRLVLACSRTNASRTNADKQWQRKRKKQKNNICCSFSFYLQFQLAKIVRIHLKQTIGLQMRAYFRFLLEMWMRRWSKIMQHLSNVHHSHVNYTYNQARWRRKEKSLKSISTYNRSIFKYWTQSARKTNQFNFVFFFFFFMEKWHLTPRM